jgi:hypothetical protein
MRLTSQVASARICDTMWCIEYYLVTVLISVDILLSVAWREEYRLRMFEKIFGPKRDEVTDYWRR